MKKYKIIVAVSFFISFVACSETTQSDNNTQDPQQDTIANAVDTLITDGVKKKADITSFLQFYKQLVKAIETKNAAVFNQLFYKDYGLYIIEISGGSSK